MTNACIAVSAIVSPQFTCGEHLQCLLEAVGALRSFSRRVVCVLGPDIRLWRWSGSDGTVSIERLIETLLKGISRVLRACKN
jgi:hypothetical protein